MDIIMKSTIFLKKKNFDFTPVEYFELNFLFNSEEHMKTSTKLMCTHAF